MSDTGQSKKKLCFVIGPIDDDNTDKRQHADWLLDGIIEPVFAEHFPTFKVERADKIGQPGMITSQIITRLLDPPLVVADMSFHNANAFYELAIRHMVGLPTIHMIVKGPKIPFDVAPHRAIVFALAHYRDLMQARIDLRAAIEEAIKPDFKVENPITHARGRLKLNEHADPQMKVVMEAMQALETKVSEIAAQQRVMVERDAVIRTLAGPVTTSTSHVTWPVGLTLGSETATPHATRVDIPSRRTGPTGR
jgi:hypothetical protein